MTETQLSECTPELDARDSDQAILYLSNTRGLYIGPALGPSELRQATPLFLVGVHEALVVNGQSARTFLLKPGSRSDLASKPGQLIAAYFPDRNNLEYQSIQRDMRVRGDTMSFDYRNEHALIEIVLDMLQSPPSVLEALMRIINLVTANALLEDEVIHVYPRAVKRLMTYIRLNPIHSIPLDSIARMEKTDIQTLKKEFEQSMGVSVQGYQIWRRLYEVAYKIFTGTGLEQAATSCGFNSEADFNMSFRNFFGMEACLIFNERTRIMMNRYGKTF